MSKPGDKKPNRMTILCPDCGHENILGTDICEKCRHSLMQRNLPEPGKDKVQNLIMTEKVSDFISKVPPIIVSPDTPVRAVIEKMQSLPMKGCVLVCDSRKKILGICSIRDFLLKVAGIIDDTSKVSIKDIMTPNPECLQKDAPLSYALHKMSIGRFRHVPVLDNGIPIGVVSTRDVIEYFNRVK